VSVVRIKGNMRLAQSCSQSGIITIVSAMRAKWVHGIIVNDMRFGSRAPYNRHNRKIFAIFSSLSGVILAHYSLLISLIDRQFSKLWMLRWLLYCHPGTTEQLSSQPMHAISLGGLLEAREAPAQDATTGSVLREIP
jgi:hypothetical protein